MKRIAIDFAHQRLPAFGSESRKTLWLACLAAAAVLATAATVSLWQVSALSASLKNELAALEQPNQPAEVASADADLSDDEQQLLAVAAHGLNYAWPELLGALERHVKPQVSFVSLEIGATRPSIKATIQAPNIDEAIGYVDGLRHEAALRGVAITKHEEVVVDGGQKAVRVSIEVPQALPEINRAASTKETK